MPLSSSTPIGEFARITPAQKAALAKLGIATVENLLYHFPVRYGDTAEARNVESLEKGETATIYGKISGLKTSKGFRSRIAMADGYVEDETGRIHCVWFNQPYVAKMFHDGMLVRIEGKVSQRRRKEPAQVETAEPGQKELVRADIAERVDASIASGQQAGTRVSSEQAPSVRAGELYFSNPKIETVDKLPTGVGDSLFAPREGEDEASSHNLYPVYPESRGTSSSWIYHSIQKLFKSGLLDTMPDPLPGHLLVKYHLPSLKTALIWMHAPQKREDALAARKRFSFEEIFTIQLGKQRARKQYEKDPAFVIETDRKQVQEFVRRFPFEATEAQTRAIEAILSDMGREQAMSRLLEGDVGSGKTAVAAATAYAVIAARLQVAYMCPTEILATQHFESFIRYFSYMPIQIALITGSGCRKFPSKVNPKGWTDISRSQLLTWVADGSISVVIGTHTLIRESVVFKNLAYAIIDEQHRFGTAQRRKLIRRSRVVEQKKGMPSEDALRARRREHEEFSSRKISVHPNPASPSSASAPVPHLLSMTATPIPRTLALTMYGDLDLTLLDQSPAGRKPIATELVLPNGRDETYQKIRQELQAGRQMYVICPRIDEPDPDKEAAIIAKSVREEAKRLKEKVFPEYEIGILHSRMKPAEKDRVMADFNSGKIHILCATSVVEVGVNVVNATVIIIEGAERFGLAQLHQLRGRVMRSSEQAYCYAFTETNSAKSIERLKALQSATNGFELAELDLAQRGAGQLSGLRQWGISDVAMEALQNLKMVEAARAEAVRIVDRDETLADYPTLRAKVEAQSMESHFE